MDKVYALSSLPLSRKLVLQGMLSPVPSESLLGLNALKSCKSVIIWSFPPVGYNFQTLSQEAFVSYCLHLLMMLQGTTMTSYTLI